jgi:hypothetical protein
MKMTDLYRDYFLGIFFEIGWILAAWALRIFDDQVLYGPFQRFGPFGCFYFLMKNSQGYKG